MNPQRKRNPVRQHMDRISKPKTFKSKKGKLPRHSKHRVSPAQEQPES